MSAWRAQLAAAAGIFQRDLTVYLSYRWRLGAQYVGVLFSLAANTLIDDLPSFAPLAESSLDDRLRALAAEVVYEAIRARA